MTTTTPTTIGEALRLYDELHVSTLREPRPVRTRIRLYFDTIRATPIDQLTTVDTIRWHQENRKRSVQQANAALVILRALYRKLVEWDLYKGACPAYAVKIKRPGPRSRYLQPEELTTLLAVLAREPLMHRLFFSLMLFVSCRPGEAETMEWTHVKLWTDRETQAAMGTWTKPRTKNGTAHTVPLPPIVARLLHEHRANVFPECPWVFPGQHTYRSKAHWHHLWVEIRRKAGIPDVRRHDLRRTCATYLLDGGLDLLTLSKAVLNHTSLNSTSVYAQPLQETVRAQLTKNSERMLAYAFGTPPEQRGATPRPRLTLVPGDPETDATTDHDSDGTADAGRSGRGSRWD